CGSKASLFRLAEGLEMHALSSHRAFNRVRNAVLYREPWKAVWSDVRDLPKRGRALQRGFLALQMRQGGIALAVVSAHFGLVASERLAHAMELTDYVGSLEGAVAVGIDLNEGPEKPAARWMSDRLFDAFVVAGDESGNTFPTRAPSARIDFLFVSSDITVHRAWVARTVAAGRGSDHLPVAGNIELPGP
ncbi:MAG: endonuclease/exonuclease/phosphatase family protein, partial [Chloroflexota bacterium]|nr:endonuclease/exonuclease/phosphatase family protein [Chloroflexota bacterium]